MRVTREVDDEPLDGELLAVSTDFDELHDLFQLSKRYVVEVFFADDGSHTGEAWLL